MMHHDPASSPSPPWSRQDGWLTTALALGVIVIFGRTVMFPFTNWDDIHFLMRNPVLEGATLENLQRIWTPGGVPRELIYIPLTYLSHLLEAWLFGLSPAVVHATNVVLHVVNVLLVFCLCRDLGRSRWIGFIAALAFAIHPLQVEAVAWAMGRKDLLSTVFALVVLLAYLRFLRTEGHSWLGLALACFLLAVLAKPSMIVLPLVLFLIDVYEPGPPAVRHWGRKIPFVLIALLAYWLNSRLPQDTVESVPPLLFRLFSVPWIGASWVERTFLMGQPVPFYVWPSQEQWLSVLVLGGLFTLALCSLLIESHRRNWRCIWFGLGFFALSFLPTVNMVLAPRDFVTADRYGYFPLIGVFFMLAVGSERLVTTWRPLYQKWLGIWLIMAAAGAWLQVGIWQDSLYVWRRVAAHYPAHPVVRNNLGMSYVDRGDLASAERQFRIGILYNPEYVTLYENLGLVNLQQDEPAAAIATFRQALVLAPGRSDLYQRLGEALQQTNDIEAAIDVYLYALERKPEAAELWLQLGNCYATRLQLKQAETAYRTGLRETPNHGMLWFNLGIVLERQQRPQEAVEAYARAIRHRPALAPAYYNLGTIFLQNGNLQQARHAFQKALELEPDASTYLNLARVEHELGNLHSAIATYQEALALGTPHAAIAWFFMADAYRQLGENEKARQAAQQALKLQPDLENARQLLEQL